MFCRVRWFLLSLSLPESMLLWLQRVGAGQRQHFGPFVNVRHDLCALLLHFCLVQSEAIEIDDDDDNAPKSSLAVCTHRVAWLPFVVLCSNFPFAQPPGKPPTVSMPEIGFAVLVCIALALRRF